MNNADASLGKCPPEHGKHLTLVVWSLRGRREKSGFIMIKALKGHQAIKPPCQSTRVYSDPTHFWPTFFSCMTSLSTLSFPANSGYYLPPLVGGNKCSHNSPPLVPHTSTFSMERINFLLFFKFDVFCNYVPYFCGARETPRCIPQGESSQKLMTVQTSQKEESSQVVNWKHSAEDFLN